MFQMYECFRIIKGILIKIEANILISEINNKQLSFVVRSKSLGHGEIFSFFYIFEKRKNIDHLILVES